MYDIVIIGGGPGGYTAAIFAAKKGKKVVLIEREKLGGTCLNVGCIPTKALIHSASVYSEIQNAEEFGIKVTDVKIDWEQIQENKNSIVSSLTNGIKGLLKHNKIDVVFGEAELMDVNTISVINGEGKKQLMAENIIIATGSKAIIPNIPGSDLTDTITSTEALSLEKIPDRLVIVGGGVIGTEMGYIYNGLGVEVTIIEMLPKILGNMDEECSEFMANELQKKGIRIAANSKVISFEKGRNGITVKYQQENEIKEIQADKVLMSIGRSPNLEVAEKINLKVDHKGIIVNNDLRTQIPNIYAIGDVTGKIQLAHVAAHQGIIAVKNILGENKKMRYDIVPSCIYTNPEMASIGLTEEEANKKYKQLMNISIFPYSHNGKSLTLGNTKGFIKIISEKKHNQVIGVHIIGPYATEMIGEAGLAIQLECTSEEIASTIHAHPTLSEAFMEAAAGIVDEAIHIVNPLKNN